MMKVEEFRAMDVYFVMHNRWGAFGSGVQENLWDLCQRNLQQWLSPVLCLTL